MSIKPWNFAPSCSKILLLCRTSWLPTFEMSCALLSLQKQLAPQTSSCSCQNKAGANSCCPREGKKHSRRDGQARCYSKCLQCSSAVGQLQENQMSWHPRLCFLSTLPPDSTPSAGSDWKQCGGLSQKIYFQTAAPWTQCQTEACLSQGSWDCDLESLGRLQGPVWTLLWLSDATETKNFDHQQGPASLLSTSPLLPPWQEIKSLV